MKRTPLRRKAAKPRRTTLPRCTVQRCKRIARISNGMCKTHGEVLADTRMSLWIRNRAGNRCEAEGWFGFDCKPPLVCAHGWGRGYHATRYTPENLLALCSAHHIFVDTHQAHKDSLWTAKIGAPRWQALREIAVLGEKREDAIEAALEWLA